MDYRQKQMKIVLRMRTDSSFSFLHSFPRPPTHAACDQVRVSTEDQVQLQAVCVCVLCKKGFFLGNTHSHAEFFRQCRCNIICVCVCVSRGCVSNEYVFSECV